jgi:magnesium-transporting ATPase (P-type)
VVKGEETDVRVLNTLEFDSTRKRMSVIIKLPTGGIRALVKGADSAIYDVLRQDTDEVGVVWLQLLPQLA